MKFNLKTLLLWRSTITQFKDTLKEIFTHTISTDCVCSSTKILVSVLHPSISIPNNLFHFEHFDAFTPYTQITLWPLTGEGYSHIKVYGNLQLQWVTFSQEIPKHGSIFYKVSLNMGPFSWLSQNNQVLAWGTS